jgi:hypothetical protein
MAYVSSLIQRSVWKGYSEKFAAGMASGIAAWHHAYKRLHTSELEGDGDVRSTTGRVHPSTSAAASRTSGGVPGRGGLRGVGGGVATRPLWRGRHGPSNGQQPDGQDPDVVLDVPELEVDRITLEVRELRPHVSVLVELANLLNLTVGVAARLDEVKLEIEGVEAEVLLKVRLKHIRAILKKALDTIGEHPEILRILSRSVSTVVRESLGETSPR